MKKLMLFVVAAALFAPAVSAQNMVLGPEGKKMETGRVVEAIWRAVTGKNAEAAKKAAEAGAAQAAQAKKLTVEEQQARVKEGLEALKEQYPAQAKLISNVIASNSYVEKTVLNERGMSYEHMWQNVLGALEGLYECFMELKGANAEAAKKVENLLRADVYGKEGHRLYWLADEVNILWPRYDGKPQCKGSEWFDSLR